MIWCKGLVYVGGLGLACLFSWKAWAQIVRSEPKPVSTQQVYLQPVAGLSFKQLGVFREGENEFSVQATHHYIEVRPMPDEYFPMGQSEHSSGPGIGLNFPGTQAVQSGPV